MDYINFFKKTQDQRPRFTRDPLELQRWMGSGRAGRGSPCRELAGAWWTAAQLRWKARWPKLVIFGAKMGETGDFWKGNMEKGTS